MLYQIGLIALIVAVALIISKRVSSNKKDNIDLVYEDEMDDDELDYIDEEIH
tara:strand:- start:1658 stop:1813 length:156 start_codon:yes stop_codon:yes gene_type:complete